MSESCKGCKWIFLRDTGYSNYTVENTDMHCVHKRNPNLPAENVPDYVIDVDYRKNEGHTHMWSVKRDRWAPLQGMRCELYAKEAHGLILHIDCDGDRTPGPAEARRIMLEEAFPMWVLVRSYFYEDEETPT